MNQITKEFEKGDIEISIFDLETQMTEDGLELGFWLECWFDPDKKFGTNINGTDDAWLDLFCRYVPETNEMELSWGVDEDDWRPIDWHEYTPTETERRLILDLLERGIFEDYGISLSQFCKKEEQELSCYL